MKVHELISMLEDLDPEADVLIMSQENWPFECSVRGVVERQAIGRGDEDEDGDSDGECEDGAPNDVFLVEGRQLRYGSKAAWEAT